MPKLTKTMMALELANNPATPAFAQKLAYELLKSTASTDPLITGAIFQYENKFGNIDDLSKLRSELSKKRSLDGEGRENSIYYLAWSVLPTDEVLDDFGIGLFLCWAESVGIGEDSFLDLYKRLR